MKEKIHKLFPWMVLLAGYIYDVALVFRQGRQLLDSDMAAEMVLSDLLNKEHAIITHSWFYSTEIRVAETQWFFRLGLLLSPDNWNVARTIGVAIALALYIATWLYFSKVMNWKQMGVWICAMLIWPFGFWYFMDITWGIYYIPHSIYMVLSLALLILVSKRLSNDESYLSRKVLFPLIVIAFLAVISGMNGVRNTLLFYGPIVFVAFIMLALTIRERGIAVARCDKSSRMFMARLSVFATFFDVVGYGINKKFFEYNYHFQSYNNTTWGGGSNSILKTYKWYIDSFGLKDQASKELFSLSGIGAGFGLVLGIIVLISVVRLAVNFKNLSEDNKIYVGAFFGMLFVIGLVFTYIYGEEQYWLVTVQFGVAAIFLEIATEPVLKDIERKMAAYAVIFMAVVSAIGTVQSNLNSPLRANNEFEPVIEFLEKEGYTQGCASFWRGTVVTELTNGKIEMWNMTSEFDDNQRWLEYSSHKGIPEGRFFCLYLSDGEYKSIEKFSEKYNLTGKRVYNDDTYIIYEYEN